MDDHHNHHHHDLPPFPTAVTSAAAIPPPQNSCYLPPILSQTCFGFSSSPPQSFFYSNPSPHNELLQQLPPHFPPYGFNEPLIHKDEGRRALDAWSTKVARSNRRLARQRTLTSFTTTTTTRTSSSSSSSGGYNDDYSKGLNITHFPNTTDSSLNNNNLNLFTFCTPDNKILRMLLKKELKNSDVGSLGRIVLPKREAEENLPFLTDKEGIQIVVRDVNSTRKWTMKYKYWANNRSRMYVLENTGEFVRQNGLLMGDAMTLYEDDCKNLYVAVEKGENNHSKMEENNYSHKQKQQQQQFGLSSNIEIKDEEEDANLALLIEELKHKAEDDAGHHPPPCCSDYSAYFTATTTPPNDMINPTNFNYKDDLQGINYNNNINNGNVGFEDWFGGLDTLPEVSGFKFPLFDYFTNNDRTSPNS